ncbi:unnamed protein product, partial [Phaeothamnion confervicola]
GEAGGAAVCQADCAATAAWRQLILVRERAGGPDAAGPRRPTGSAKEKKNGHETARFGSSSPEAAYLVLCGDEAMVQAAAPVMHRPRGQCPPGARKGMDLFLCASLILHAS